jgi:hypothetical protein
MQMKPRRWRRKQLAEFWSVSDRTIDRMRKDGRLGEPVGYLGKIPLFSDEQRQAAESAHRCAATESLKASA